ncbi:hypothetical protein [Helicobacter sp. MIT 05-5294]|uniref:hypothetical protein n=1 Tax=Helicobacter sp. MIT 05-5294 TaxID=1548150 RepID=UPI00051FEAD5|nr:hypothetical protein [Helicobacter sp. MIT 05-5294]
MKFKDFKRILMSEYKNKAIKDRIQRLHSQDSFIKMVETGVVNFGSEEFRIKKNIIRGKFCYMWLESKTLSFWSVTSAIPFFAIIPSEKAILIWRKELEEPLESCLRVIDANKGANRLNQQSLMIYLSYSRPGHFYEHMNYYYSLFGNNRIKPDIAITTGDTFFDFSTLEDAEGINVLKFKDINALNRYCLESKRGVVKIKRTNIRVCFDECDHWIKKYNVFSCQLHHTIPKDAFVLWINICGKSGFGEKKKRQSLSLF